MNFTKEVKEIRAQLPSTCKKQVYYTGFIEKQCWKEKHIIS